MNEKKKPKMDWSDRQRAWEFRSWAYNLAGFAMMWLATTAWGEPNRVILLVLATFSFVTFQLEYWARKVLGKIQELDNEIRSLQK